MKPIKRSRFAAVLLAAVLTFSLAACGGQEPEADVPEEAGVAVQIQPVAEDAIATENKVSGKVSADNEYTILIASAAKCTAVYAKAGDQVQAGDILCTLDLGSALASYNAARISYSSALQSYNDQKAVLDKQVQLALDNVNNTKALFEIGAASQLEVDQAELNYQSASAGRNATLSQLEAGIQNAQSGVEQLDIALEDVDSNENRVERAALATRTGERAGLPWGLAGEKIADTQQQAGCQQRAKEFVCHKISSLSLEIVCAEMKIPYRAFRVPLKACAGWGTRP